MVITLDFSSEGNSSFLAHTLFDDFVGIDMIFISCQNKRSIPCSSPLSLSACNMQDNRASKRVSCKTHSHKKIIARSQMFKCSFNDFVNSNLCVHIFVSISFFHIAHNPYSIILLAFFPKLYILKLAAHELVSSLSGLD